jgi:dUTP pyrophosphatase
MTHNIEVKITKHPSAQDLSLPKYATAESAGMDLMANINEPIILAKGERKLIPTGLAIQLPSGYEAQIRPRSGLAIKNGITVLNTPGTIDADYRGEIMVILINLSDQDFKIERGMRIAQMIIAPFTQAHFTLVDSLDESERGHGGFGSTGVK